MNFDLESEIKKANRAYLEQERMDARQMLEAWLTRFGGRPECARTAAAAELDLAAQKVTV